MTLSWIDEPSTLGATRHYRMHVVALGYLKDVYASAEQVPAFAQQFLVDSVNDYCQKHAGSPPNATKLTACLKTPQSVTVVDVLANKLVGTWSAGAWHPVTSTYSTDIVAYERHPAPRPSAPGPMTPGCMPGFAWDPASKSCKPARHAYGVFGPSAPPPMVPSGRHATPPQPSAPGPMTPGPSTRYTPVPAPTQPSAPPAHSAPPPFPCPTGTEWNGSECMPTHRLQLGFTFPPAVSQAHAKGILSAWGHAPGVSAPYADYGVADVTSIGWSERDGVMLHAFAQWWTGSPQLNPGADQANANGVVVAQLTDAHVAALDAWFVSQGGKLPGVQTLDALGSRSLLVLWGKTDGHAVALDDYGLNQDELAPTWTKRDTAMLKLFQTWWNESGKPALGTDGTLDAASSNALKQWLTERLAKVPAGWTAPGAQPPPAAPPPKCASGMVWDETNKACQPLPAGVVVSESPAPSTSSAVWWLLGGVAVVGGLLWYFGRGVGAAMGGPSAEENPKYPLGGENDLIIDPRTPYARRHSQSKITGPAYRLIELPIGARGKYGEITQYTADWARVGYEKLAKRVTLHNWRDAGHEFEGRVRIRGKWYSAFTSGGENPDGGNGMIIVRTPKPREKRASREFQRAWREWAEKPADAAANPTRQVGGVLIRSDDKWKDFVYGYEVPEKVRREDFDWLDDAEGVDHFFKYHNTWYHLSQFTRTAGGGAAGAGVPTLEAAGWQGIINESASTGVVIKVSADGEQYKVGSYRTAPT